MGASIKDAPKSIRKRELIPKEESFNASYSVRVIRSKRPRDD